MVNYIQTIVQTLIARLTNFPEGLCVTPLINPAANSVAVLLFPPLLAFTARIALATCSLSSGSSRATFLLLGLRVVLFGDLRAFFFGGRVCTKHPQQQLLLLQLWLFLLLVVLICRRDASLMK